ncbi:hypothetical protein N9L47_13585 [Rhodobacteraceae bacterium]|nr:hypothetical protein [Paracoccaceae bacterium]
MALAQEPVALNDPNIGMSAQLNSDLAWQVDVTSGGGQSTIAAVHQDGENLILLQVVTMLEVNPAAQSDAARVEFTTNEFLEGLCGPFSCADMTDREYIAVGDRHAWVLETDLGLQDFKSLGLTETIMAATTTPQGYMQLFSLHTAPGQSGDLKEDLIDAVASASFE